MKSIVVLIFLCTLLGACSEVVEKHEKPNIIWIFLMIIPIRPLVPMEGD